jgi:hypothetical protein
MRTGRVRLGALPTHLASPLEAVAMLGHCPKVFRIDGPRKRVLPEERAWGQTTT